jgi:hypothetical protein
MEKLVLKEVDIKKMIKGATYIVKQQNETKFIGEFAGYEYSFIPNRANITNAYSIKGTTKTYEGSLCMFNERVGIYYTYYEVIWQKYKIQSAMETRSTNIILQRIVNDDTFTYL